MDYLFNLADTNNIFLIGKFYYGLDIYIKAKKFIWMAAKKNFEDA